MIQGRILRVLQDNRSYCVWLVGLVILCRILLPQNRCDCPHAYWNLTTTAPNNKFLFSSKCTLFNVPLSQSCGRCLEIKSLFSCESYRCRFLWMMTPSSNLSRPHLMYSSPGWWIRNHLFFVRLDLSFVTTIETGFTRFLSFTLFQPRTVRWSDISNTHRDSFDSDI